MLFDTSRKIGSGKTIGEDIVSRSKLSSRYVNAGPGDFDESWFRPFPKSTRDIASRLIGPRGSSWEELEAHYLGEAAVAMSAALENFGISSTPYANALTRVANGEYASPGGKFQLALMLFVVCGCLGDPRRAVALEEDFAEDQLGASIRTSPAQLVTPTSEPKTGQATDALLGIARINVDGTFPKDSRLIVLPKTETGATIGAGDCDITDVGPHVSRRHARIYFADGHWQIVGLRSTNGTAILDGADGKRKPVEPPKALRKRGYVPQPHGIAPADIICLTDDTRFIVRVVSES